MEGTILRGVELYADVERAVRAAASASERLRRPCARPAGQVDPVDAQCCEADAAHVADAALHVHRVVEDEAVAGPPGVRHQGRVCDSRAPGLRVLVDLDRSDRGWRVVDGSACGDRGFVPEPVDCADVERVSALRVGKSRGRIQLERVLAAGGAGGWYPRGARDELW